MWPAEPSRAPALAAELGERVGDLGELSEERKKGGRTDWGEL